MDAPRSNRLGEELFELALSQLPGHDRATGPSGLALDVIGGVVNRGRSHGEPMTFAILRCGRCGSESVDVKGWVGEHPQDTAEIYCVTCQHSALVSGFTLGRVLGVDGDEEKLAAVVAEVLAQYRGSSAECLPPRRTRSRCAILDCSFIY